jgi:DNA-binding transcriptional LysR family regulator
MNISIRQLTAFLQISRLSSFTRAAEQIHVTQAGLSAMIQDLEQQLGCRLFNRTTRAVSLTAAGTRLLPAAERMLEELHSAASEISQVASTSRRTLSVAATPLVAASLLPKACLLFRILHPDVTVRIRDIDRSQVQELVESGECDVGFGVFFKPASGIERVPIFGFDLVHVTPDEGEAEMKPHSSSPQKTVAWTHLRELPLIGLPPENPIQRLVDTHLEKIGRANEDRLAYNNFQTLIAMVEAGFGTTILPSFLVAATAGMRLRIAELVKPRVGLDFYKITKKGREQAESIPDFVNCLVDVMNRHCSYAPRSRGKGGGKRFV